MGGSGVGFGFFSGVLGLGVSGKDLGREARTGPLAAEIISGRGFSGEAFFFGSSAFGDPSFFFGSSEFGDPSADFFLRADLGTMYLVPGVLPGDLGAYQPATSCFDPSQTTDHERRVHT